MWRLMLVAAVLVSVAGCTSASHAPTTVRSPVTAVTTPSAAVVLPDPRRTPGAINQMVTQSNIHSTICVSGWTSTIRPASSYTTALKRQQLATGYAYHGDMALRDYEEDHLISLEIGGSPDSVLNLWPEPYAGTDGARTKDVVENRLNKLICSGSITLAAAQAAIATDWWAAYQRYVGTH